MVWSKETGTPTSSVIRSTSSHRDECLDAGRRPDIVPSLYNGFEEDESEGDAGDGDMSSERGAGVMTDDEIDDAAHGGAKDQAAGAHRTKTANDLVFCTLHLVLCTLYFAPCAYPVCLEPGVKTNPQSRSIASGAGGSTRQLKRNRCNEPYPLRPREGTAKNLLHAYGKSFEANGEKPVLLASVRGHNMSNGGAQKAFERLSGISTRSYNHPGESLIEIGFYDDVKRAFEPKCDRHATHFCVSESGKRAIAKQSA